MSSVVVGCGFVENSGSLFKQQSRRRYYQNYQQNKWLSDNHLAYLSTFVDKTMGHIIMEKQNMNNFGMSS